MISTLLIIVVGILTFWNEIGRCLGSRNSFLSFSFSFVRHLRSLRDCTSCTDLTLLNEHTAVSKRNGAQAQRYLCLRRGRKTSYVCNLNRLSTVVLGALCLDNAKLRLTS